MKSVKGRKISLPWFRQSSVQKSHAALSRQHTIDNCTAKSFEGSKNLQVQIFIYAVYMKYMVRSKIKIHDDEFFFNASQFTMRFSGENLIKIYAIMKLLFIYYVFSFSFLKYFTDWNR